MSCFATHNMWYEGESSKRDFSSNAIISFANRMLVCVEMCVQSSSPIELSGKGYVKTSINPFNNLQNVFTHSVVHSLSSSSYSKQCNIVRYVPYVWDQSQPTDFVFNFNFIVARRLRSYSFIRLGMGLKHSFRATHFLRKSRWIEKTTVFPIFDALCLHLCCRVNKNIHMLSVLCVHGDVIDQDSSIYISIKEKWALERNCNARLIYARRWWSE